MSINDAAKFLDTYESMGTIQHSIAADLVLLNDNPLEDISGTQDIEAVIINGN